MHIKYSRKSTLVLRPVLLRRCRVDGVWVRLQFFLGLIDPSHL